MSHNTPFPNLEDLAAIVKPHNDKLIAEGRLANAEREISELLDALRFIAEFKGKTLIAPSLGRDCDQAHQLGANKAFEQAADAALDAIAKAEGR